MSQSIYIFLFFSILYISNLSRTIHSAATIFVQINQPPSPLALNQLTGKFPLTYKSPLILKYNAHRSTNKPFNTSTGGEQYI